MNKHKKLGITALVLDAIAIWLLIFTFLKLSMTVIIIPIILIAGIIISIISLKGMKKHHSKGLWIPISAIVISAILLIPALYMAYVLGSLFMAFMPAYFSTFEVPMELTMHVSNLEINPIESYEGGVRFIFVDNNNLEIPEYCMPEFIRFGGLTSPEFIKFSDDYFDREGFPRAIRGKYDNTPIECIGKGYECKFKIYSKIGSEITRTFLMKFDENNDRPGTTKIALKTGTESSYVRYYYLPAKGDPEKNRSVNISTCYFREDLTKRIGGPTKGDILEVKGTSGKQSKHETQFVCVKKANETSISDYSKEGCKYYELSYDFEISYNIDLSKGRKGQDYIPIHI